MNVVFFGASELGVICCEALINVGVNVSAIFSIPQDFKIKFKDEKEKQIMKNVLFKDFSHFQKHHNIPVIFVEGNIKDYSTHIASINPDLILVIGWYYLIPASILELPKLGSLAVHASLLPKYRGNAPLVWAMINGEKKTGISLFYLEGRTDEGDIVAQQEFSIDEADTIKDLLKKTENASINIILNEIPKVLAGVSKRTSQDHTQATYFPKRTPKDGEIDWNWDADKIERFIKAQTKPYPGAFTYICGKKVTIWDSEIQELNKK